jgi:hypothetical protein
MIHYRTLLTADFKVSVLGLERDGVLWSNKTLRGDQLAAEQAQTEPG